MKNTLKATGNRGRSQRASARRKNTACTPALTPVAVAIFAASLVASVPAQADSQPDTMLAAADFDINTLIARGIDPKVAAYFRHAPRFAQGVSYVTLVLNGKRVGRVDAHFDGVGELCFDKNLLNKAGLQVPSDKFLGKVLEGGVDCYDYKAAFPQTEVTARPGREEIAIVVSQDALAPQTLDPTNFQTGGIAAIANYDVSAFRSEFSSGSSEYMSAATQLGFNAGDWVVRSRQMFNHSEQGSRAQHLYTYAQRSFMEHKAVLQAGQINVNSPLFSTGSITGIQVLPEAALIKQAGNGALVEGIAQDQATVEVRQNGALIYSTLVPQGPFALSDIPLLSATSDLNVTVREIGGDERHFVVPAASFRTAALAAPGYTFAAGKLREIGEADGAEPALITGTGTWSATRTVSATAGGLFSEPYQAVGWGADAAFGRQGSVSVRQVLSNAVEEKVRGSQASVSASYPLTPKLSVSASSTQNTLGYRDISDTLYPAISDTFQSRIKAQYTASMNWNDDTLGSFGVSLSSSRSFNGAANSRLTGSWGRSFKHFSVNATVESGMGGSTYGTGNDKAAYVNISIPLGKRSVRSYVSQRGDQLRTGLAYSDRVNDQLNYRLRYERDERTGNASGNASVSAVPRYTSLDLGYSQSDTSRSFNGRLSGGAVAHRGGLTFSPYQVQDTVGIIDIPNVSGVKISTPNGPVWTDFTGQAVVSQLSPYRTSRLEVQSKSLPRRVDLANGFKAVDAGRGAVTHTKFEVIQARRMLVNTQMLDGEVLPKGAAVFKADGSFVTTVLDNGTLFLADADPNDQLTVAVPDKAACQLNITYPKEVDNDAFYDVVSASCVR